MLPFLLACSIAHADPASERPVLLMDLNGSTEALLQEETQPDDPTEALRDAVRSEDLEALKVALAAGADPWNSSSGPTPVWMALDRPRSFLEAMLAEVPPERHAALLRVWSRLDPEDPRRALLDAHVPGALQRTEPALVRDWLDGFSAAEQDALIRVIGLELMPAALAFPPHEIQAIRLWFGDAWLPRVVWLGPTEYDYSSLRTEPAPSEAHRSALRAGWNALGLPSLMEAEGMRQDLDEDGKIGNLLCGVTDRSTEDQVRSAFGRPYSGAIRRSEGHLYWPEVQVYLERVDSEWRVERVYMTGDPQGCWSKGARLIGVPAPFARWVLGPEPWVTQDGAHVTVFAGEDGHVSALELVWPPEDES